MSVCIITAIRWKANSRYKMNIVLAIVVLYFPFHQCEDPVISCPVLVPPNCFIHEEIVTDYEVSYGECIIAATGNVCEGYECYGLKCVCIEGYEVIGETCNTYCPLNADPSCDTEKEEIVTDYDNHLGECVPIYSGKLCEHEECFGKKCSCLPGYIRINWECVPIYCTPHSTPVCGENEEIVSDFDSGYNGLCILYSEGRVCENDECFSGKCECISGYSRLLSNNTCIEDFTTTPTESESSTESCTGTKEESETTLMSSPVPCSLTNSCGKFEEITSNIQSVMGNLVSSLVQYVYGSLGIDCTTTAATTEQ